MKNIYNIINEEFELFLSEGYSFENDAFKFTDNIRNPLFYNYDNIYNDYDVDIINANLLINWHLGFWINENGIEKVIPYIDSITGIYQINLLDIHTDEIIQTMNKDISEINWEFKIKNFSTDMNKSTYIESVVFDVKSKICEVHFNQ